MKEMVGDMETTRTTVYGAAVLDQKERSYAEKDGELGEASTFGRRFVGMRVATKLIVLIAVTCTLTAVALYISDDTTSIRVHHEPSMIVPPSQEVSRVGNGRSLLLIRHAKSSWDDPSLDDIDRPLAHRGEIAALRLGAYLEAHHVEYPQHIYSSPSLRTRLTLERVQRSWAEDVLMEFNHDLYTYALTNYTDFLGKLNPAYSRVLLVGHNPAMGDLVKSLLPLGTISNMPTGTYCEIHWEDSFSNWAMVKAKHGKLISFITPKDT